MSHDNRAIILAQALRLFAARGYDAVSVREIVEAAGVTKPTLYHYFGSKRGLLDALLREHFEELYRAVAEAAEYHGDLVMNLNRLVAVYFDFARRRPVFYRLLTSTGFAPPDSESFEVGAALYRKQISCLEAMFRAALPHMEGRHGRYAVTLHGMISTYVMLSFGGNVELSDALVYQAVHQYMHGIYS
jgi:AcrR family transcriptional regulator